MATVGNTYPSLKDYYSQLENGKITSTLIDLFLKCNPMLEDAVTIECNDGTSHKTTVRNGLPEPEFRKFYQGVPSTKGEYTQIQEATAMLEDFSKVDKISTTKDTIGYQVLNGGGTGTTNTSIWFVGWGEKGTHLIYPKGSKAGLQHENIGEEAAYDADRNEFRVYKDHFSWDIGMCVRNYKTCARIANIDTTKLGTDDAADLIELMIKAYHRVKKHTKLSGAKLVIYVNETIETYLHLQAMNKTNVRLSLDEAAGEPVLKFLGIPVKCCDAILDTEDKVAAA